MLQWISNFKMETWNSGTLDEWEEKQDLLRLRARKY